MNKEWHLKNPMPEKATKKQRMEWHLLHSRHCACRPIPAKLLEEMKQLGIYKTIGN